MTKNQEITTRQLIDTATEIKNSKGHRTMDFIPGAYGIMENIVLAWERGEHTSANFRRFKANMSKFIEALEVPSLTWLQLDTFDKCGRSLWQTALKHSGYSGDCIKKALHLDDAVYSMLDNCPEFTRLLIENYSELAEAELLEDCPLPKLARTGHGARYESLDNLRKLFCFLGYKYQCVTALAGMGEHDFLKIHTFRKEVR